MALADPTARRARSSDARAPRARTDRRVRAPQGGRRPGSPGAAAARRGVPRALAAVLMAGLGGASAQAADDAPRPNIVVVFSDDHATRALSAYGSGLNETPGLDRLADEGARFDACIVGNPICAPSRATLLTGAHSHVNGVRVNGDTFDSSQPTFPKLLQGAGYTTALIGKWHLRSEPTGFDHFEVLQGQGQYYNPDLRHSDDPPGVLRRHEGHVTAHLFDRALTWLDEGRDRQRPFLLMVQPKAPHRTWMPAPEHLHDLAGVELPEPPTLLLGHDGFASGHATQAMTIAEHLFWQYDLKLDGFPALDGAPPWDPRARLTPAQRRAWDAVYEPRRAAMAAADLRGDALTRAKYQLYIKDYLNTVAGVDAGVARLLQGLDERGLARDTLVVYASDQGFFLGEHGFYDKRWMYEPSARAPLLVRWPGVVEPGTVVEELVQNTDFAPTFCELAGVDSPARMQGRSLVPLLRGERPDAWRTAAYTRYHEFPGAHDVPRFAGVRTARHKLIWYEELDEWELFDLVADPDETTNLWSDPAHAALADRMTFALLEAKLAARDTEGPQPHLVRRAPWQDPAEDCPPELRVTPDEAQTLVAPARNAALAGERPPNVVLILCDDLGWYDLGVQGGEHVRTPHLDRMAAEGLRLTNFHAAQAVCSASRAAYLTGCYPTRLGIRGALAPGNVVGLHDDETTLGELLQSQGYATALFGKWHLGWQPMFNPTRHGFDRYVGIPYSNDMSPDVRNNPRPHARNWPPLPLFEDEHVVELEPDQALFTRRFTDESLDFIRDHAHERFAVVLTHPMPHVPLYVSEEFQDFTGLGLYADVLAEIDHGVGRIRALLDELHLAEDTLVMFTSDNGPWRVFGDHAGQVGPLRGSKGNSFEGGIRVPFVAAWPGTIPAGATSDELLMSIDILPTLARLAGAELPEREIDGRDASELLLGAPDAGSPQDAYGVWYAGDQLQAVLSGAHKLILEHTYRHPGEPANGGVPGNYTWPHTPTELYDLAAEIGERTDVSASQPEARARLDAHVADFRARLGDKTTGSEGTERREVGRLPDG